MPPAAAGGVLPERDAACLSRLFFCWLNPVMALAARKTLTSSDVWPTHPRDASKHQTALLERRLKQQEARGTRPKSRLFWALVHTRGWEWLLCSVLKFTGETVAYFQPVLLSALIAHVEHVHAGTPSPHNPFLLSAALVAALVFRTLVMQYYVNTTCRVGLTRKTAFMGVVLRKAMAMPSSLGIRHLGAILNVISNDAEKAAMASRLSQNLWFQPVATVLCMSLLYSFIGVSAFVGFGVMLLLLPLQVALAKRLTRLRRALLKQSDERVRLSSDLVVGMRAIKLLVWQPFVLDKIDGVRRIELARLRSYLIISMLNYLFLTMVPIVIASGTFAVFVLLGNELKASVVFAALSLLGMLAGPLHMFPRVLSAVLDGLVGIERASRLLVAPTFTRQSFNAVEDPAKSAGLTVEGEHFSWSSVPTLQLSKGKGVNKGKGLPSSAAAPAPAALAPQLVDVRMELGPGELGVVLGSVGAGKSTLLAALLGECPSVVQSNDAGTGKAAAVGAGRVWKVADAAQTARRRLRGSVAYVPQVPFIYVATARDNILFGKTFDKERYQQVVAACALEPDFAMWPAADATEIGERGINLSGGQKMRVSLARALYSDAQVYLLDDPLAAVDAHVGAHIWNQGVMQFLRGRGKVVLLTTNNVHYAAQADRLFLVAKHSQTRDEQGKEWEVGDVHGNDHAENVAAVDDMSATIVESGTREEVMALGGNLSALLSTVATVEQQQGEKTEVAAEGIEVEEAMLDPAEQQMEEIEEKKEAPPQDVEVEAVLDPADHTAAMLRKGELVRKEKQETGVIKQATWGAYFDAVGWGSCFGILLLYLLRESCKIGMDIWIADWSDKTTGAGAAPETVSRNGTTTRPATDIQGLNEYYLAGYLIFALVALVASIVRSVALLYAAVAAGRTLFRKMLLSVSRAPMSWFDSTPTGRILNRFSADTAKVDEKVPTLLRGTIDIVVNVTGTLVLVAMFSPWFLLLLPIMGLCFYHLQHRYRCAVRELKRMHSTSRSPIFANLSGALQGLDVLKASEVCDTWVDKHHTASDRNFVFGYLTLSSSRWASLRFEMIGTCMVAFVILYISISATVGTALVSAGMAGAALMNIMLINRSLLNVVRSGVELEMGMNAVERVDEYISQLPQERPDSDKDLGVVTEPDWPAHGRVSFDHLCLRYRPHLEDVLNDVSLEIAGGEKIGIVGRTGSGKSTLALALFRMVEPRAGTIRIDGIDICSRGLHTLRSRIAIVPQAPTLFEGTLRYNLDPHQRLSEDTLWEALRKTQLVQAVEDTGAGLDAPVAASGTNFSVGQRQLICLARAICHNAKVLVLDECSASVDLETDNMLQEMIRKEFQHATVLTIAHRLNTVAQCDKVLVMEAGRVVEYDAPQTLLRERPEGHYAALVREGLRKEKDE